MSAPWRLEITAQGTCFTSPDGAATTVLPVGHDGPGAMALRGAPPRPAALEEAIMVVEDALMAALPGLPRGVDQVRLSGAAGARVATALSLVDPSAALSRDALEEAFRTLAAVAEGRPAGSAGLPLDAAFAATLLILREVMHHLDIGALVRTD